MLTTVVQPLSGDADSLERINNTAVAHWFESARSPFFRIFAPDIRINLETSPLILAHSDYHFVGTLSSRCEFEIRSWVTRIGIKSFTVYHEAWQKGRLRVKGTAVLNHYDNEAKKSTPIPAEKKIQLKTHLRQEKAKKTRL